jgi:flagellar capping protein FliD
MAGTVTFARSQDRLQVYSDQLRKQFAAMDGQVAQYQSTLSSLSIKA